MDKFDRIKQFASPPAVYRGKPFWSWNGELERDELLRQTSVMKEMGFGGYYMHTRVGMATPYLSDEWMQCIEACAEEAGDMQAWVYDENGWPSGFAGGILDNLQERVFDELLTPVFGTLLGLWSFVPDSAYEEAKKINLDPETQAGLIEKADYYHYEIQCKADEILNDAVDSGVRVMIVAGYNIQRTPLVESLNNNSDATVDTKYASAGATVAPLNGTLGENYVQACDDCGHNHLSPDGMVDTTTGLLPCSTWLFKGQAHELLPHNDVALKLAIRIMTDNNMVDVYSNPEEYPQFNNGRLTNTVKEYMLAWEEADKAEISNANKAAVEAAIADVNALLDETVVDAEAWAAAEKNLGKTLTAAGVIEDPEPSVIENAFTAITKTANKAVNATFKYIGK